VCLTGLGAAQTLFPAAEAFDLRGEHFRLHAPEPALAMLNPDDEPHSCRGKARALEAGRARVPLPNPVGLPGVGV
jgi:hypothetical protein